MALLVKQPTIPLAYQTTVAERRGVLGAKYFPKVANLAMRMQLKVGDQGLSLGFMDISGM
jgi:hypothetical protein